MGAFDFLTKKKETASYTLAPWSPSAQETYSQFSGFTKQLTGGGPDFGAAFQGITDFASNVQAGAADLTSGAFLDPSNPVNQSFIEASNRPLQQQFKEQTIPGLESYLAKSGGTGGSRGTDLIRQAYRDFETVLGDNASKALATIGGTRAAGFQSGAYGGAYAEMPILEAINSVTKAAAVQGGLTQQTVQSGVTKTGSTLEALQGITDLGLSGLIGYKLAK